MASIVRVNSINARTGLSTVTLDQSGVGIKIAGVCTATSFSGSIAAANVDSGTVATARLGSGTANNTTFLRGDSSWQTVPGTTINSNTDNYLITGTGTANTLQGEDTLSYDGTSLLLNKIAGNIKVRSAAQNVYGQWYTGNAYTALGTESNDYLYFFTNGLANERLRITSAGQVLIGETSGTGMSAYDLGMKNSAAIRFRNAAGNAWINTVGLDNSNNLKLGWGGSVDEIHFGISGIGEQARFDSGGRLLIGTTTEGASTANTLTLATSTNTGMTIRSGTANEGNIFFSDGTSGAAEYAGMVRYEHNNDEMVFKTGGSNERLRITATGVINKYDTKNFSLRNAAGSTRGHLQVNGNGVDLESWLDSSGFISFTTNANTGSPEERMRVTSAGSLLIGASSLHSESSGGPLQVSVPGSGTSDVIAMTILNTNTSYGRGGIRFGSKALNGYKAEIFGGVHNSGAGHGQLLIKCANATGNTYDRFFINGASYSDGKIEAWPGGGGFKIYGNLTKSSGSFRIAHPLVGLSTTKDLVHSFIEGPQADLVYRGVVTLSSGTATVNIDNAARMTSGTFVALVNNVSCFTSNETDWTAVKGSVSGNILTITAESNTSTATVSWLVVGERKDPHMLQDASTDSDGRLIVEPDKDLVTPYT